MRQLRSRNSFCRFSVDGCDCCLSRHEDSKTLSRILKIGGAWTALEQAGMWVLERCEGCADNDCVVYFLSWANNVTNWLCWLLWTVESREVGPPG